MLSTEETLPEEVRRISQIRLRLCNGIRESTRLISSLRKFGRCGVSNHHDIHRTVSQRVVQSVFQRLLLWIQAQPLLQPRHSLMISRRTRSDNFACTSQFDVNILSGSNFQTPQQQTNSADFKTPNCLETPEVCAAPKKQTRRL